MGSHHLPALDFKDNAKEALSDPVLQQAMQRLATVPVGSRAKAVGNLPEFEDLRDQARDVKNHVLANLDIYLEQFEAAVTAAGGHVHWAQSPADARNIFMAIAEAEGATRVTKGKSMVSEEVDLNNHLEANGIEPIETDLGEYIIQLAGETPSHIIAPAAHKTKASVEELFDDHHQHLDRPEGERDAASLVAEARAVLRQRYFDADIGVTGSNFLIAETGSTIIVTNEGNGDLTQHLPKTHVVFSGIEKIVPTLEDLSLFLRILARSATGQETSNYVTLSSGTKQDGDRDGPENFHVILLDNGRSDLLGTEFEEMLRCIRCGACMNHCPVYGVVGGHSYGSVYPGPIGSILTPNLIGIEDAKHLPFASSLCGRCESVCPVRIPIPKILRHWREKAYEGQQSPKAERYGLALWAFLASRPALYRAATRLASLGMRLLSGGRGYLRQVPFVGGWVDARDLPTPTGDSFMAQYKKQRGN